MALHHPVLLGSAASLWSVTPDMCKKGDDAHSACGSDQSTADTLSEVAVHFSQQSPDGMDSDSPQFSDASEAQLGRAKLRQGLASVYEPGRILHSEAAGAPETNRPTLLLANALTEPVVPPPPPPPIASVGSAGHLLGLCKPCDFASRFGNGCRAGDACKFCHLCGPVNLRKSKRMRRALARAAQ
jgi:hypothetical protein